MNMESSARRVLAARQLHRTKLALVLVPIVAFGALAILTMWSLCPLATRAKWYGSVGLVLDLVGAVLVALPLFMPYQDPVEEGKQFLSYYEPIRSIAVIRYQERLTLPMQVGAALFILGFVFQIVSQWA